MTLGLLSLPPAFGARLAKRAGATAEPTRRRARRHDRGLFSACTFPPLPPRFLPPSFPSVKNLYFISELWSSSAQLSADKAQEALERRHGYLEEGGGVPERQGSRRTGWDPTPQGRWALTTLFFFSLLSLAHTPSPPPP